MNFSTGVSEIGKVRKNEFEAKIKAYVHYLIIDADIFNYIDGRRINGYGFACGFAMGSLG